MTLRSEWSGERHGVRRLAAPFRYLRLLAPIPVRTPEFGDTKRQAAAAAVKAIQAAPEPRRTMLPSRLVGLIFPALLLALWEAVSRLGVVPRNLLPSPSAVFVALYDLALRGELAGHIEITLIRVFLGFVLGTIVATLLGALTGYSTRWRRLLDPLLQALQNVPSIAWVPLFILWLGIFEASKVALIAVGVFFPVYLNLMSGIQQVDRKLVEVGRIYGYTGFALVRRVLLPATLPFYVTGLRSGLGLGWMFVLAAEFMGASEGLGYLLIDGEQTGRPQIIIGSIILFALLGKACDLALVGIARRFISWQDSFVAATERQENARDQRPLQAL
jgi:sulfonate transport system permease protein